jgi:IS5 family transposase
LVYHDFTKVGAGKMPDAKTMGRWGLAAGPEVIEHVQARLIKIAQERGVVSGRRIRVGGAHELVVRTPQEQHPLALPLL